MKYDVFVSYRRTDAFTANLVAEKLKALGYSVFFDVETLRGGVFNEQLYEVIRNCNDVVLVLPPDGLDRCVSEEDWIRKEICYAMECQKNIIPVLLTGFEWPSPMPVGMEQLKFYQAVTATSAEYFDLSIKKLATYLKSKPSVKRKLVTKLYVIAICILTLVAVGYGTWRFMTYRVCDELTNQLSSNITVLDFIYVQTERLDEVWENYKKETFSENKKLSQEVIDSLTTNRVLSLRSDVEERISYLLMDSVFTKQEVLVCAQYDISESDLEACLPLMKVLLTDYINYCDFIINIIETSGPTKMNDLHVRMRIDSSYPSYTGVFYSYISMLSAFPKYTLKTYRQHAQNMRKFNSSINMSMDEYEYACEQEWKKVRTIVDEYKIKIEKVKSEQSN